MMTELSGKTRADGAPAVEARRERGGNAAAL